MKTKIFSLLWVALLCSAVAVAETRELFSHEQTEVSSSGGAGDPDIVPQPGNESYRIDIVGTPGWQWGNTVKIKLNNVSAQGLSPDKMYKLSFTAVSDNDDCPKVSLRFFDDNVLFYTDEDFLSFSTTPFRYESDWLSMADETQTETNATILWDFGWAPQQTITLSNFSFLETDKAPGGGTALKSILTSDVKSLKFIRNGQLYFLRDGKTFNAVGAEVR